MIFLKEQLNVIEVKKCVRYFFCKRQRLENRHLKGGGESPTHMYGHPPPRHAWTVHAFFPRIPTRSPGLLCNNFPWLTKRIFPPQYGVTQSVLGRCVVVRCSKKNVKTHLEKNVETHLEKKTLFRNCRDTDFVTQV